MRLRVPVSRQWQMPERMHLPVSPEQSAVQTAPLLPATRP